jgi:hypothetical protein
MTSFRVTPLAGLFQQIACHGSPQESAPPRRAACVQSRSPSCSGSIQMNFLPSHDVRAFGACRPPRTKPRVVPVFSSRPLPAFSGRDFITTTDSSATLHRFVSTLSFLLSLPSPLLPGTVQGFPSYFGLPVSYPTLTHSTGLTRYRASRFLARSPTRKAVSGSLALCAAHFLSLPSDPAVTSNALAIRIVFPLVRATSVSSNRPGRPGTLGKQKAGAVG